MFSAIATANRALEREHWARTRLAAHADRVVRVQIGPASQTFAIDGDGWLRESEGAPDLKLTIPVLRIPAVLTHPERWPDWVSAEGDAALAATLRELARTLPWFVEAFCARAFGPVAGQRIADLGRRLLDLPGYAAQRFADSVANYVDNDARFAAGAAEARVVAAEISALAAGVDALAQRIDALAGSTPAVHPSPPPRQGAARARRPSR